MANFADTNAPAGDNHTAMTQPDSPTPPTCPLIDVDAIVRSRLPRQSRFIPRFLTRMIELIIKQDGLNRLLKAHGSKTGAEFCRGVLEDLKVTYRTVGQLPERDRSRVIYVSNHPLGGLDGIVLIDLISRHHGRPVHFIVNDLLMAVTPLRDIFLPVNKHGAQSRRSSEAIDAAMDSDDPIIMFPAGLVSRRIDGKIADLKWNKMFVNKAVAHNRDIIPLYFDGRNSSFFYNFAHIRTKLGLKFNYEMVRLPAEVFKAAGKEYTIHAGSPIACSELAAEPDRQQMAGRIREIVYALARTD